jgi:hypothetical protein
MTVVLNTNVTLTNPTNGIDFDVGVKSLDRTITVDFDFSTLSGSDHVGLANNRHGNAGNIAGAIVAGTNQIWIEAAGIILAANGDISFETWFRELDGVNEMTAVKVGSLGAYRKARIEHTVGGVNHVVKVYGISALGGAAGPMLVSVAFSTGSNHDMRSVYFSPFVASFQPSTYRCIRKD